MTSISLPERTSAFTRLRRRHGWLAGVIILFFVLLFLRLSQVPVFGGFGFRTVFAGSLTLAFLAMAQAAVVISGGINMAVGSLMVFSNCLSARLMEGQSFLTCVGIAVLVLLIMIVISTFMGYLTVISGVPDIIVTLAASFVIGGAALLVLPSPGGGVDHGLQEMLVGGFSNPVPAMVILTLVLVGVWLPFKRSRWGVAIYGAGSNRRAAYLSGVNVQLTRVNAYALSGLFVGLAGIITTAFTGGGEPRASIGTAALLSSVAAVVLGGVALTGGVGGLVGPVFAALVLGLIPPIMLGLGIDPNYAEVARGVILILVVMLGGFVQFRRRVS